MSSTKSPDNAVEEAAAENHTKYTIHMERLQSVSMLKPLVRIEPLGFGGLKFLKLPKSNNISKLSSLSDGYSTGS